MWEYLRIKKWVKSEPRGRYSPERPRLFRQLVFHMIAEDLIGDSEAAELLYMKMLVKRWEKMAAALSLGDRKVSCCFVLFKVDVHAPV